MAWRSSKSKKAAFIAALMALLSSAAANHVTAQNPAAIQSDRRERLLERQPARLDDRLRYYDSETWTQLESWLNRNRVRPLPGPAEVASNVARAVDRVADVSAAGVTTGPGAVATYGYSNPASPGAGQGWFYDYYAMSPRIYGHPVPGATAYGSMAQFRDLNNDGLYDYVATYRTSPRPGVLEPAMRYDFSDFDDIADGPTGQIADAQLHTVTGQVDSVKTVNVNNASHLIARIIGPAGADTSGVVDLGPAEMWQTMPISPGDRVTASGPKERVGDRDLIVAHTVTLPGREAITVNRMGPEIRGVVVDVLRSRVRGTEHMLAIVDTGQQRQIVDFGPADGLRIPLAPNAQVAIQGVPVSLNNYQVLLAERLATGGQTLSISRW
jgi:hypothetical protein